MNDLPDARLREILDTARDSGRIACDLDELIAIGTELIRRRGSDDLWVRLTVGTAEETWLLTKHGQHFTFIGQGVPVDVQKLEYDAPSQDDAVEALLNARRKARAPLQVGVRDVRRRAAQ